MLDLLFGFLALNEVAKFGDKMLQQQIDLEEDLAELKEQLLFQDYE